MFKKVLHVITFSIISLSILFIVLPIIHIFIKLNTKSLYTSILDLDVLRSIITSLYGGFLATILGCILGIPLGFFLSKKKSSTFRPIIESIVGIPVAIPHVAVGIALLSLFNERTIVGKIFNIFHITFVDTLYGVVIAMLFVSLSFIVSSSIVGFDSIDEEFEMVSRSLGASSFYTFIHITFPLAFPSILRGAIMAFARSISEVGAILIIAYYPKTAPIIMYERFEEFGLSAARPVAALVIFLCSLIFFTLLYLSKSYVRR